ncbi:hypothetical protein ACFORG_23280 [Lutimaribacter marinistellae]|uniref:Uncharacterized protein n=1 Tax=Lutimaribacter marinistellae TaxID=1820329 RepID=A0ABV7TR02_9RHOB
MKAFVSALAAMAVITVAAPLLLSEVETMRDARTGPSVRLD